MAARGRLGSPCSTKQGEQFPFSFVHLARNVGSSRWRKPLWAAALARRLERLGGDEKEHAPNVPGRRMSKSPRDPRGRWGWRSSGSGKGMGVQTAPLRRVGPAGKEPPDPGLQQIQKSVDQQTSAQEQLEAGKQVEPPLTTGGVKFGGKRALPTTAPPPRLAAHGVLR